VQGEWTPSNANRPVADQRRTTDPAEPAMKPCTCPIRASDGFHDLDIEATWIENRFDTASPERDPA